MSDAIKEDHVVIERTFNAPVELVWQMWTDADHFKNWYGPEGLSIPVAEMDVRVGGKRHICMEMPTPDGTMKMWTGGEYTEVVPHERLVYTDNMVDEDGNSMMPPNDNGESANSLVTVVLEAVDGGTKMVMTHAGLPEGDNSVKGAQAGWTQSFKKLGDYIKMQSA